MEASSVTGIIRPPPPPPSSQLQSHSPLISGRLRFNNLPSKPGFPLRASRRPPNFPHQGDLNPRNPNHMPFSDEGENVLDDEDDDDDDDDDDDRSLDLLIRFVDNLFKKVSKRARKSVRSVLPQNIPTNLVGFSVNGVIILAFFWILKAFLEVVCTLGSVVFVSILLVRGVWTGISYFQDGIYHRTNDFDDDNQAWSGTQPIA